MWEPPSLRRSKGISEWPGWRPSAFTFLRHADAGRMLTSGEELAVASHLLGRSSLDWTLNTKGVVAPEVE
ncbi:MAG TPA: hypothetical protein VNH20_00640 [Candidatus Dormibacteraeota bacterium]|nr:hypothetical protein [Candidatus Dormibacteraeota bacterium]